MSGFFGISIIIISIIAVLLLLAYTMRYIFIRKVEKKAYGIQNAMSEGYYHEILTMYGKMRGWRHDYHSHIQVMKAHIELGNNDELKEYLNKLEKDLEHLRPLQKSGNLMIDAILNSKISIAVSRGIRVKADAEVAVDSPIDDIDLCIIIGNLLDNAIDACSAQQETSDKFIRIYINTIKEQLYISVSNSMDGKCKRTRGSYLTTKGAGHGFGGTRIDYAIRKYSGYINRQNEEGIFAVEVMLPLISDRS